MAITVPGELGIQLAKLQQEAAQARRRVRDAETAFATAQNETVELDARLAKLEGQEMAGHNVTKEIKSTTKSLQRAREGSSDEAKRELAVLRAHQTAREEAIAAFIVENAHGIENALWNQAQTVVSKTREHITAALGFRELYMETFQSFHEFLMLTRGDSRSLPSADGAHSFYRDLERFAENSLRVPAPRTDSAVAA